MRASSAARSGPRLGAAAGDAGDGGGVRPAGLVAAPVFYAYVKRELVDQRWI
jgi:hypothetical protein